MNWIILILALFLIVFEAVHEGLKIKKKHIASGVIEFIYLAIITLIAFAWISGCRTPFEYQEATFWKVIGGYLLLRFALFDLIWNISADQRWFYLGRTKLYDRFLSKVPTGFIWFIKVICIPLALAWLLNYGQ